MQMIVGAVVRTFFFFFFLGGGKFSEDTAMVSLPLGDQDDHGPVVSDLLADVMGPILCLNVSKAKDLSND